MSLVVIFSLLSVFSMLLVGLTDETLEQVLTNLSIEDKNDFFDEMVKISKTINDDYCIISNVILTNEQKQNYESYLTKTKALGDHLYFNQNTDVVNEVNDFVSKKTNNQIKNIISSDDIDDKTNIILLNTIYFNAKWLFQFHETEIKPFHKINKKTIKVEMMIHPQDKFKYFENDIYQAISLPYTNNNVSMIIILPINKKKSLIPFDYKMMKDLINKMTYCYARVEIPKFEQETEIDLKPFFQQHGMTQMFEYMHADDMHKRDFDQKVTSIKQKCKIVVNEYGTEACASTAIITLIDQCGYDEQKIKFIANHPFAYHIVNYKNMILFSGTFE